MAMLSALRTRTSSKGARAGVGVEEDAAAGEREPVAVVARVGGRRRPGRWRGRSCRPSPPRRRPARGWRGRCRGRRGSAAPRPAAGRLPVVRVAAQLVDLVLEDAHLGERAGGDRVLVGEGDRVGHVLPDVLGHDLLRRHLVEAGDEDALEAEVDGARRRRPARRTGSPTRRGGRGPGSGCSSSKVKATSRAREGAPVRPQHAVARGQAQDAVPLAPLVRHGQPRDVLGAHAVEDEERLVDAGQRGPARGGGGGQRVEVADPGGLLLLRDDQHAGGGGRRSRLHDAAVAASAQHGGARRASRERARGAHAAGRVHPDVVHEHRLREDGAGVRRPPTKLPPTATFRMTKKGWSNTQVAPAGQVGGRDDAGRPGAVHRPGDAAPRPTRPRRRGSRRRTPPRGQREAAA